MVQQVSQVPFSSMIITGETGTGKGLVTICYFAPEPDSPTDVALWHYVQRLQPANSGALVRKVFL
jgi:hypothetical protein